MDAPQILSILNDWNFWTTDLACGVPRESYVRNLRRHLDSRQVVAVTGPRRSGKSYLMRQLVQALAGEGVPRRQILIINLEDPRFPPLTTDVLQQIFDCYRESVHRGGKPFLFLDEVQEVEGWEKWVRMVHELDRATVVVSGSNAKLLSRELATLLTGRHVDQRVLPLTFAERLRFANVNIRETADLSLHASAVKRLFSKTLEAGGFPEVAFVERPEEMLLSYYDDIVTKDIIRRHRVRKREELKRMAHFYASNISCPITFNSIARHLEISPESAENFSAYMEAAFLLFFVRRFSPKVKEQERSPRKVYAVDTGLANVVGTRLNRNDGAALENFVFLELAKRAVFNPRMQVFYWKSERHKEVDFLVQDQAGEAALLQVCWSPQAPRTRDREVSALVAAMEDTGVSSGLVITSDEEAIEERRGHTLRFVPAWKWACGLDPTMGP